MLRILIIEDEARLARLIRRVLRKHGYAAETAEDGRSGLRLALMGDFDLLVVDWMLPEIDGVQLVRRLRAAEMNVPVLMLTARSQVEDRVEGLDAGADDYLPKPFAFSELLARVRAISRWPRDDKKVDSMLRVGSVTLDPVRHVVWRNDERIDLTAKEFALLAAFMQRPSQIFTRSVLLDIVWDGADDVYTNVVDLYVSYLRKKLDRGGGPSLITTVRGVGYSLEPDG